MQIYTFVQSLIIFCLISESRVEFLHITSPSQMKTNSVQVTKKGRIAYIPCKCHPYYIFCGLFSHKKFKTQGCVPRYPVRALEVLVENDPIHDDKLRGTNVLNSFLNRNEFNYLHICRMLTFVRSSLKAIWISILVWKQRPKDQYL